MNNNQSQVFQNPNSTVSQQNQYQIENAFLKSDLNKLKEEYKVAIESNKELKNQKEFLEKQVCNLQQQLNQRDQEYDNLRKFLEESKIYKEKQQELINNCIEMQLTNQKLQKQLDQLVNNKQILQIECKPNFGQNISEEVIHISWQSEIDNLQLQCKRNKKLVKIEGYGEIDDNLFICYQQCELSRIPISEQPPVIIQKESELLIKYQI
ncbi:unnamed protein product [Paramecium octaurelia]|uniref:Uncharacterized protein n=1 Tax=Paramecium octaurelia TaxID=43137 RepID=A0A8S1UEC0_PAROT|nr:unnamed protein product [Paramecium octaurelia]